jgi:hypothetical protein
MRQVRIDSDFGRIYTGRERPKGEDARVGDNPHLQQDTALSPCHFAYKLLAKTNPSS